MSKTSELLELGEYFDRMGVTTEDFDRQTFVNRMNAVSKVNPSQAGVNRALYATIASLQQQLAAKGAGGGGSSGAAEIEKLMKTDYNIFIYISRATSNILATNTVGSVHCNKAGSTSLCPFRI